MARVDDVETVTSRPGTRSSRLYRGFRTENRPPMPSMSCSMHWCMRTFAPRGRW